MSSAPDEFFWVYDSIGVEAQNLRPSHQTTKMSSPESRPPIEAPVLFASPRLQLCEFLLHFQLVKIIFA
jgi:hypothetical protein